MFWAYLIELLVDSEGKQLAEHVKDAAIGLMLLLSSSSIVSG